MAGITNTERVRLCGLFVLIGNAVSERSAAESEKPEASESSTALSIESVSVDVPVSGSQGDLSSVAALSTPTQPLPPPPPPPPVCPTDPTSVSYYPALPPPPVERFPVRLRARYAHPDVRWRFGSTIPFPPAPIPQPFYPPPVLPHTPCPVNYFVPATTQQSQTPETVSRSDGSQTGKSSPPLSSPAVISAVSETVSSGSAAKSSSTPVIRDFKAKGVTPRFVPRQLKTAQTAATNSERILRKPDTVIEELKQNAFVLSSKVQGPSLPSQAERKRKEFKTSETGSESLDKTVSAIREKVSQVRADVRF